MKTEILCEWMQSDAEMALRSLARQYHERTEAFDHAHCQGRNERGVAIPVGKEVLVCTLFARKQRQHLGVHAAGLGFDQLAWNAAIVSEARCFDTDWVNGMYHGDPRFNQVAHLSS